MSDYELYLGDCLVKMGGIADRSIDCILADWPYGVTSCVWDSVIPLEPLWKECKRVIKPKGAIVLFGAQPFTTTLINSNPGWFKHCWIWDKSQSGSFQNAQYAPLRITEDVIVFSDGSPHYYPQMRKGVFRKKGGEYKKHLNEISSGLKRDYCVWNEDYFPTNIINFPVVVRGESLHPSQKPTTLLAYLVKTYTNEGETVLDNTFGSCSTGVACLQTGRNFIGIEKDPEYFAIGKRRMEDAARAAAGLPKKLIGIEADYTGLPMFSVL